MRNIKLWFVITSIAVILIVLALVASGCGTTVVNKSTLDTLQAENTALQQQIATLQQQLLTCKVDSEKVKLSTQIADLQRQLEQQVPDTSEPDD